MEANRSVLIKFGTAIRKFLRNIRGAILIEFAVGMPLLLMMLFGMHDIFKMIHMQDKTNFAAHLVVQMIQNVSQARKDKKITLKDLGNISSFAGHVIYPGTTQYAVGNLQHVYAHCPWVAIVYVRGESGGKATTVWRVHYWPYIAAYSCRSFLKTDSFGTSSSKFDTKRENVDPSRIWPTLRISEGEVKIIVEVNIIMRGDYSNTSTTETYPDGSYPTSAKQLFGLYLLSPPVKKNAAYKGFFHSIVIFTPKKGLFDEEGPK